MKKLLIFCLIQFFVISTYSQQDSVYKLTVNYFNKVIKEDRVNYIEFREFDSFFYSKLLDYFETIKLDSNYGQISYAVKIASNLAIYYESESGLDFGGYSYRDSLEKLKIIKYNKNRTLKIRQRAVNFILDVYNYPGIRGTGRGLWMFEAEDFDQQVRQKIAFLLSGNITNSDFERHKSVYKKGLHHLYEERIEYNTKNLYDILQQEIKKTGKPDSIVRDSLYKVWEERDLKNFKLKKVYNIELLHVIGRNYMYEFEPQIRSLMDTVPGFPVYFCKLIFARFGREPVVTDFFKSVDLFEYFNLYFKKIVLNF